MRKQSLVDADADLADLLDPATLERARREAIAAVRTVSAGAWDVETAQEPDVHHRGFLVADGLLTREVEVLGRRCVELIGPGDVLRPWSWDEDGAHVRAEIGWSILEPTQLLVLDHGLVRRIDPFPQLGVELFTRGTRRAHALAVALAIVHHQRVEDRVLLTLWHLGERWGRVGADGVVVDLPLSHERMAGLIGATRPSTTTAIGELTREGRLHRRDDGCWVLRGEPPRELRRRPVAVMR